MQSQQLTVALPSGIDIEAQKLLTVVLAYKIDSQEMYELAADELKSVKSRITAWENKRKEIVDPLNKAVKGVNDFFRRPIEQLQQAESALKRGMLSYVEEQERLRREQEEKARREREEAERKAVEEAQAAQKAADEAAAKAAQAETPEEQAQAQAALIEATTKVERAHHQQQEIITTPTPIIPTDTPKVSGISKKTTWRGECHDFQALVKAVAEGKAPITLLELKQSALNQMARALGSAFSIPGCKAVEEKTLASTRG